VVLSRWKVDDAATALLMARFYEGVLGQRAGLKAPLGRAAALAEAKAWLRAEAERRLARLLDGVPRGERSTLKKGLKLREAPAGAADDRPFAHPYYWAAFVLIGDPD
jgi:CHAT domain-containing protein